MKEKILYLIGAGASCISLPLARTLFDEDNKIKIPGLAQELRTFDLSEFYKDYRVDDLYEIIPKIKSRWIKIADNADAFGDVDTYAKYLYIMYPGGDEFQELKQGISEYFALKQIVFGAQDNRYLPWLVSIMNNKIFPENVKVLTWNYDYQIELAYSQISPIEDANYSGTGFSHSPSLLSSFPNLDYTFQDYDRLSLMHLNGIAGYIKPKNVYLASIFQKKYITSRDQRLSFFKEHPDNPQINFAWENNQFHPQLMKHVINMIKGTTKLVVIGYSFPFFNREIDKQIFKELKSNLSFNKIYYQDPFLKGDQLVSQFNLDKKVIKIVHIAQTNNFHIPFEY